LFLPKGIVGIGGGPLGAWIARRRRKEGA